MKKAGGKKRRDEVMLAKRLEVLEEGKLVKEVVNKLREDGGFGWWEEYEVLRRKYELGSEYRSVHNRKEKIKVRNEKDCVEEVGLDGGSKQQEYIEAV